MHWDNTKQTEIYVPGAQTYKTPINQKTALLKIRLISKDRGCIGQNTDVLVPVYNVHCSDLPS